MIAQIFMAFSEKLSFICKGFQIQVWLNNLQRYMDLDPIHNQLIVKIAKKKLQPLLSLSLLFLSLLTITTWLLVFYVVLLDAGRMPVTCAAALTDQQI